jgi:branched-subunit amino acid transport protein
MSPIVVLLFGALGTYALRLLFVTLVPAHLLPQRLRDTLPFVGPAALAALVATDVGHAAWSAASFWPTLAAVVIAVVIAGVIAAVSKNLGLTVIGGLGAGLLVDVLI